MSDPLGPPSDFVWRHARLLDRRRFEFHFCGGSGAAVLAALVPYQNDDGGFGHALEPDLRTPASQPVPTEEALRLLVECGGLGAADAPAAATAGRACDWLASVANADGGLPFVLPSATEHPRAPWWQPEEGAPSKLNPTAGIAALLAKGGVAHPFAGRALAWARDAVAAADLADPYTALAVIRFLAAAGPDDERRRVSAALRAGPEWRSHPPDSPLLAPGWEVDRPVLEHHLDTLAAAQQPDGGWPIQWEPPSEAAVWEWRGKVTVDALVVLKEHGRL